MKIDKHDVRTDSIDGVTEITLSSGDVHEGTDRMARGSFEVLVRGQRLRVYRAKRCRNEKVEIAAAINAIFDQLDAIRQEVVGVLT